MIMTYAQVINGTSGVRYSVRWHRKRSSDGRRRQRPLRNLEGLWFRHHQRLPGWRRRRRVARAELWFCNVRKFHCQPRSRWVRTLSSRSPRARRSRSERRALFSHGGKCRPRQSASDKRGSPNTAWYHGRSRGDAHGGRNERLAAGDGRRRHADRRRRRRHLLHATITIRR